MELSKNTHIEQVCVVGMNLPQTMALVVLSADAHNIDKRTLESSLETSMQDVNQQFEKHERLKKVVIMKEEWTIENNMITPTLKVKRNILEKEKAPHYERWYKDANTIVWEN